MASPFKMLTITLHLDAQPGGVIPELHLKQASTSTAVTLRLPRDEFLIDATMKPAVVKGILPDGSELFISASTENSYGKLQVELGEHFVRQMNPAAGKYKCTLTILNEGSVITRENYMDYDFLSVLPFTVIVHEKAGDG